MEHLIPYRGEQPALDRCGTRRKAVKEKRLVGDIKVFIAALSALCVLPDQISVLSGNAGQLHVHFRSVICPRTGQIKQKIFAVFSGKRQVVPGVSGFQLEQAKISGCQDWLSLHHILLPDRKGQPSVI